MHNISIPHNIAMDMNNVMTPIMKMLRNIVFAADYDYAQPHSCYFVRILQLESSLKWNADPKHTHKLHHDS